MRITLLILMLCLTGMFAHGQIYVAQHQELPYQDTSKHIKAMRAVCYGATMLNGKVVKGDTLSIVTFYYDKFGNLVKRIIARRDKQKLNGGMPFAFNDSAMVINKPVYDEHGNLVMLPHDAFNYALSGTFKYNESNQIISITQTDSNPDTRWNSTETFTYNANNKLADRIERTAKGQLTEKTTFEYDKAGHVTQVITADDTHIRQRTKLIYDNLSGKLMHLVLISDDGEPPVQYDYEYDNHDRKLKIYVLYGNTKNLYSFYKYNSHDGGYTYTETSQNQSIVQTITRGHKKRERFENGRPLNVQEWDYDKHNNPVTHLQAAYPPSPQKLEPVNITVTEYHIAYRSGFFSWIGNMFKPKPYPPRAGGM